MALGDSGRNHDTASLTERIELRRRKSARGWWIAGACLALVVALGCVGWFTPVLALQRVDVRGATLSDPGAIAQSVEDSYRSVPLPQIRLGALGAGLERQFPKAKRISVTWGGPRTLRVTVQDRVPRVAWRSTTGWTRYDADGRKLDLVTKDPELPLLTGSAHGADSIRAAVAVLGECSPEQLARVKTVNAGDPDGIELGYRYQASGGATGTAPGTSPPPTAPGGSAPRTVTIVIGDPTDVSRKLDIALRLAATGADRVDVSVPTRPVTR